MSKSAKFLCGSKGIWSLNSWDLQSQEVKGYRRLWLLHHQLLQDAKSEIMCQLLSTFVNYSRFVGCGFTAPFLVRLQRTLPTSLIVIASEAKQSLQMLQIASACQSKPRNDIWVLGLTLLNPTYNLRCVTLNGDLQVVLKTTE
jgi:hypothetical protein